MHDASSSLQTFRDEVNLLENERSSEEVKAETNIPIVSILTLGLVAVLLIAFVFSKS